jgi:hypothetical protein
MLAAPRGLMHFAIRSTSPQRAAAMAPIVIALLLLIAAAKLAQDFPLSVVIALLLSYTLRPLVSALERLHGHRLVGTMQTASKAWVRWATHWDRRGGHRAGHREIPRPQCPTRAQVVANRMAPNCRLRRTCAPQLYDSRVIARWHGGCDTKVAAGHFTRP